MWQEQAITSATPDVSYDEHLVILCETTSAARERLTSQLPDVRVLTLHADSGSVAERFQRYAGQVFEQIQALLNQKLPGHVLVQIVVATHGDQQLFAGLVGMLKTARIEHARLIGQLIELSSEEELAQLSHLVQANRLCLGTGTSATSMVNVPSPSGVKLPRMAAPGIHGKTEGSI
nr:hypothetical protein [Dictyobacter vulcani]